MRGRHLPGAALANSWVAERQRFVSQLLYWSSEVGMQPPAIKTVSIGLKELRRGVQSSILISPGWLVCSWNVQHLEV